MHVEATQLLIKQCTLSVIFSHDHDCGCGLFRAQLEILTSSPNLLQLLCEEFVVCAMDEVPVNTERLPEIIDKYILVYSYPSCS